ncbi:hypothetical protein PROFUN_07167 [Planoprotostelium fungivorum]|uniref:Uncharacterized protein n=1 Tax=Planoprotostelium fungivorum TaxID=1890364 RepID=A0A2P6NMA3_9EUKA|nr:hypothetical protein PROFUN_07167 [Planoprotostelium fungivorum]
MRENSHTEEEPKTTKLQHGPYFTDIFSVTHVNIGLTTHYNGRLTGRPGTGVARITGPEHLPK